MYFREVLDSGKWNAAVKTLGGSIAQCWEWGLFHQRLSWQPLRLLDEEGRGAVQLLLKEAPRGGSVAYAPYGPLAASSSDLAEVTESVARWVRRHGAYLLKIEPKVDLEAFRQSSSRPSAKKRTTFLGAPLPKRETSTPHTCCNGRRWRSLDGRLAPATTCGVSHLGSHPEPRGSFGSSRSSGAPSKSTPELTCGF